MAIYYVKCGARHECSVCPVCAGFGLSNLQAPAGVGKSFQQADELRAKFEAWAKNQRLPIRKGNLDAEYALMETDLAWASWQAAHASRDAEVEALRKDAERYQLLRSCSGYQAPFCVTQNIGHDWIIVRRDELDQAIDAAMREESK